MGTPDSLSGSSVLRALIHPDRIPIKQILQKLQETDIVGMRRECQEATVATLAREPEKGGKFRKEEVIIAEIIARFNQGE